MNNTTKILTAAAIAIFAGTAVYAGPHHGGRHHHHDKNNGIRRATDIVRLVSASLDVLRPRPVVVAPPARVIKPPRRYHRPAPPPPPRHHPHGRDGRRR